MALDLKEKELMVYTGCPGIFFPCEGQLFHII